MNKFMCTAVFGLCTLPAMAGPSATNPLQGMTTRSSTNAGGGTAASASDPLPSLQFESSLTVPGFGEPKDPALKPLELPGLAVSSPAYKNAGKNQGTARLSDALTVFPQPDQKPTTLSTDYAVPQKGQVSTTDGLVTRGYGKESHPAPQVRSLPLGGTLTRKFSNGGRNGRLNTSLNYTSPAPKSKQ